jgi:chromosome segregation ATPase
VDQLTSLSVKVVEGLVRAYGFDGLWKLVKKQPGSDDPIAKLEKIQSDLQGALAAVAELERGAKAKQQEAADLQKAVTRLQEDKKAVEDVIKIPEEAFARMHKRASAKGRGRGLLEGLAIGLVTGFASSLLVWYLTKP